VPPRAPSPAARWRRFLPAARRAWRRIRGLNERVVSLPPAPPGPPRGRVLLSYVVDALLVRDESQIPHSHPHFWETWAMAQAFRDEGYAVDVVHWTRRGPPPRLDYDVYVDVRRNFERYAAALPPACLKIAHMDTAHPLVHNGNQARRLDELRQRRGIRLAPFKHVEENRAAEQADLVVVLGNDFTADSFARCGKPVRRVRLSNAFLYPFPESKDFAACRNRFLWMGSEGFVHKGLDLVLDAFADLPDHELVVCGPLAAEPAFEAAYADRLYRTPNIRAEGWIDVASERFRDLARHCLGMVYPSCSEGGGGCLLTAMHAGLVPVATREASVDLAPDRGLLLPDASVESIQAAVRDLSARPPDQLESLARAAWTWVRQFHTRERFAAEYRDLVRDLDALRKKG
jgi:glycosyltransferase involved in cell wall biosynthesis